MDSEVQQLIEMGATTAQAKAALSRYKDVMQAAEMIFSGAFDDLPAEDEPVSSASGTRRPITPDDDDDDVDAEGDDDDNDEVMDDGEDDYNDFDSDYEMKANSKTDGQAVDPYAGIFFSKSRREEVVEVDEDPEFDHLTKFPILSRGEFMRGCPEAQEQTFLFSLYNKISEPGRKCPSCSEMKPITKSNFLTIYPSFESYTNALRQTVVQRCKKCKQEICVACGENISENEKIRATHQPPYDPLFHCSDLQGIILGMGLYMIDNAYADEIGGSKDGADGGKSKKRKIDIESSGKSTKKKSGIGYDGAVKEDTSGQIEAHAAESVRDAAIGSLMSQVRVYLPSLQREGGSQTTDYLVSPTALAHLRRRFNSVASSLLRNDSLTDMADRSVLYFELFEWLQTISNHEALASMVAMPIMIPSTSTVVTSNAPSGQRRYRERKVVYEGSSGPRELMESLVIQATAAKKGLEGQKSDSAPVDDEMTEAQKRVTNDSAAMPKGKERARNPIAEENIKLLSFCDRILTTAQAIDRSLRDTKGNAFVERMYSSLPRIPSKARPNNSTGIQVPDSNPPLLNVNVSDEEAKRTYEEWATATRFEYCDLSIQPNEASLQAKQRRTEEFGSAVADDIPNYMSYYNSEARLLVNSDIPKRSLAIAKELAVLTTNLPVSWNSSIFLRVDETRVDIIKALITGPEDTPYYNGCYLFDIFLGPSYNTSPPSVKYMTTNSGRFRFNPNLYADGKVCLSLLGTWSGPGWVAGKSTLLQVLISIQSMILCDEPYLNEPGWANGAGSAASIAYSANVRRMVVHTAMLGNIKNPPEPFRDIILTHFRLKSKSISAQLDDWLSKDDGKTLSGAGAAYVSDGTTPTVGPASNGFRRDVEELKGLLAGLARGEDPPSDPTLTGTSIPTPSATAAVSQTNLPLDPLE